MSFKVGDRVRTTDNTMGPNHTQYHGVVGKITAIRAQSSLPIMFKPDVDVTGESPEWALFENEVTHVDKDEEYWKRKYLDLKAEVTEFRYNTEGM